MYQYTYGSDENDPSTYGMLLKVATAGEQTYTYVETNAEGMDTVSSTTSTKTIEESYTYQDSETNVAYRQYAGQYIGNGRAYPPVRSGRR